VTTIANAEGMMGYRDGESSSALFHSIRGICYNLFDDCIYICDSYNGAIRKLTPQGMHLLFLILILIYLFYEGAVSTVNSDLLKPWGIVMYHKEHSFFVTHDDKGIIVKMDASGKLLYCIFLY
jgi:hypothetical protein